MRRRRVRRLLDSVRQQTGEVLFALRGSGRRPRNHNHRGTGQERRAELYTRSLCKALRFSVRLLHAGNGAGELRATSRSSRSERGKNPQSTGRQSLYVQIGEAVKDAAEKQRSASGKF